MVQLCTSENELLTCDHGGSIKFWDCDVPEPVSMIVTIPPNEVESTKPNPNPNPNPDPDPNPNPNPLTLNQPSNPNPNHLTQTL